MRIRTNKLGKLKKCGTYNRNTSSSSSSKPGLAAMLASLAENKRSSPKLRLIERKLPNEKKAFCQPPLVGQLGVADYGGFDGPH